MACLLNAGILSKWLLCNSLQRIRDLLRNLHSTVTHIFKEANRAADKLATMEAQDDFLSTAFQQLPGGGKATILLDGREIPFVRTQVVRA